MGWFQQKTVRSHRLTLLHTRMIRIWKGKFFRLRQATHTTFYVL
uniref:Uncharacterized protein n=1 Tax=Anguilla anguilla TaxID=7936 RepID=A0A0E9TTE2_ANGAN